MIKIYSAPNHIKVPKWDYDYKKTRDENLQKEKKYEENLKNFIVLSDSIIEFLKKIEENYPNISFGEHSQLLSVIQLIIAQSTVNT